MSKEKTKQTKKISSAFALRHGTYAIVFTAIIVAAFIIVNILATALTQRFPLNIDLTANNDFSVSSKNIEYIQSVSRPVTITVCSTEGNYATYMATYASNYYNASDSTGGKYYAQTMTLLDEYTKHNSNIKVVYADPQSPEFADIQARVGASAALSYGSLLVESTFDLDGEEIYRSKVLSFDNLYTVEDTTGGYAAYLGQGYAVSGSNVESAVTSAIYSVTSDKTTEVGYVSARMESGVLDNLNSYLSDNNYNVTAIDNLLTFDINSSIEILVIAAPTADYSADELSKLDAFLDNDGNRGKTLVFFGSANSPELPNLYAFLSEWGIDYSTGTVYETNSANYLQTPATIGMQNKNSDYTAAVNNINRMYIATGNLPMRIGFESQGNRTTTELIATSDTVVRRPAGADESWSADNEIKTQYSGAVLSCDKLYNENRTEKNSYVLAFSSADFISSNWSQYTGTVGNMEILLSTLNNLSGRDADEITFTTKTIEVSSFSDQVTALDANIILTIFVGIIPIGLVAAGIIIWIRRRNR